ncbi:hydroxyacylglutathione hydrolase [Allohahella marinimesophila]|uniref:Hydroxyacylglutathione hydrolase n=1 Tax=Allohahella marinimesophila TaxID=1054972 RepID=A0ABP7NLZ2_9GAMM
MTGSIHPARIELEAVPAFNDNYIWCFRRIDSPLTWVVDPGQAAPAIAYLETRGLKLAGILLTHHHPDHTGGVGQLISECWHIEGECPVFGSRQSARADRIPHINRPLGAGEQFEAAGLTFETLSVPGHTLDHVAFFTDSPLELANTHRLSVLEKAACGADAVPPNGASARPLLFCGDTLFSAGCGRLFEGTPEQMLNSLDSMASLPASTMVCCGHEYTLANLAFTAGAWPDNKALPGYRDVCERLREAGEPTLPSSLAIEHRINPFMNPELTRFTDSDTDNAENCGKGQRMPSADQRLQAFTQLRAAKDKA